MNVDGAFGGLPADAGPPSTADIVMAAAAGMALLATGDRDPMRTTTFGVGELMRAAIELGCRKIILGIGGSATVDAGIGCAQATGHTIVLQDGEPVSANEPLVGADLERVVMVKRHRGEITDGVEIVVACDVTNPLYGPTGAARVFGPQKGATPDQVQQLDDWMRGLSMRNGRDAEANAAGAGAAGGLGFGLMAFFGARLVSGIDLVVEVTHLRDRLRGADLCLTAEGRLDSQSVDGKAVAGVAKLCKGLNVPCIALAGSIGDGAAAVLSHGVTTYFSICDGPMTLEQAIDRAPELLRQSTANVVRVTKSKSAPPALPLPGEMPARPALGVLSYQPRAEYQPSDLPPPGSVARAFTDLCWIAGRILFRLTHWTSASRRSPILSPDAESSLRHVET
jgi:glycerate kinase